MELVLESILKTKIKNNIYILENSKILKKKELDVYFKFQDKKKRLFILENLNKINIKALVKGSIIIS